MKDEHEEETNATDTAELQETVIEEKVKDEQGDVEQNQEPIEEIVQPEITNLSEIAVSEILANPGVNLPKISVTRLAERDYADEEAIRDAITAEVAYITALTGAGKPKDLGSTQALRETIMTEADRAKAIDDILVRHGMRSVAERMT